MYTYMYKQSHLWYKKKSLNAYSSIASSLGLFDRKKIEEIV